MPDSAWWRRARVVRIYDTLDRTVILGRDGQAHELRAESAELAKELLQFLLEAKSRQQIVQHIEALTATTLAEGSVVDQLLGLLTDAGALELVGREAERPRPMREHPRIVLCVSGGVAAMYAPSLISLLQGRGFDVRVAATKNAMRFLNTLSIESLVHHPIAADMYEGETRVPHIDLATWAEAVLVWPATATTLSRLATGDYDSLVSAIALATSAPVVVAPSMNAGMYAGAAVQRNVEQLVRDGMHVIHPSFGIEVADAPLEREQKLGPAPPILVVVQMLETALVHSRAGKKHTPRSSAEWDRLYAAGAEELPWYTEAADADLVAALERLAPRPSFVLDIGTGLGQVAVAAAERGHRVVATELSAHALDVAAQRAPTAPVLWLVDDITNSRLHRTFDVAVDRGCLHLLSPAAATRYARGVAALVSPGGSLLLKTHDASEGDAHGTTPYTRQALETLLGQWFEVIEEHDSTLPGPDRAPAARLFVLSRKSAD
jgi:SAM-dependent methyltransferase